MVHNRRTRVRRKKRCNSTIKKGGKGETLYVKKYKVFKLSETEEDQECENQFNDPMGHKVNVFVFVKKDGDKWNTKLILAKPPSDNAKEKYDDSKYGYNYCVAMLITRY